MNILSIRLLVNCRLLIVKFWESQKLYMDFHLGERHLAPLSPCCLNVNCSYFTIKIMLWNVLFNSFDYLNKTDSILKLSPTQIRILWFNIWLAIASITFLFFQKILGRLGGSVKHPTWAQVMISQSMSQAVCWQLRD